MAQARRTLYSAIGDPIDDVQFMFEVLGNVPVAGEIFDGMNGLIYLGRGQKVNAIGSFAAIVPLVGTGLKYGVKGAGKVIAKEGGNLWKIGSYKAMKGMEKGLDAHHVGQSAVMKKLIPGYDPKIAPTILVPKLGHTIGSGVVSRSTSGFTNARQVLARDILELRRVYGPQGIPNSALQELIQMNKTMYPSAFTK